MTTPTLTASARRELAQRSNDGLEITLYWNADNNSTSIDIRHLATDEIMNFPVPADQALDAFHHPFAHLAEQTALALE